MVTTHPRRIVAALAILGGVGAWLALAATAATAADASEITASAPTTAPATSQPETQPATQPVSQPTTTTSTSTSSTSAPAGERERVLAIVGGRVHTVSGPVLADATVLCRDGVIIDVGRALHLPAECTVVDAHGLEVYPGLVAATSSGIHPPDHAEDGTDVFGVNMTVALAAGITTCVSGASAVKNTFGETKGLLLRPDLFLEIAYSRQAPLERRQLRLDLDRVQNYLREAERYERAKAAGLIPPDPAPPAPPPAGQPAAGQTPTGQKSAAQKPAGPVPTEPDKSWLNGKYEQYLRLLRGERIAVVNANSASDLRALADLAATYGLRLAVRGAYEGWIVAPDLGRAHAGVIITPRTQAEPDHRRNAPNGATIENAARLAAAGVRVAVVPASASISFVGLAGRDLLHLNMEAAFAVRGGLSNDAAVGTITLEAARVLGIDDRVGSIDVGKDADLVVCDGDLLHYMTQVRYTVVNGRVAYDKSHESLFAHIRPTGERKVAAFDDQWPRRLAWPEE